MHLNNIAIALLLTFIAGISTGFGGLFVLFFRRTNTKLLSVALGFSAGVMIYISFVEVFNEARINLINSLGQKNGEIVTVLSFFCGILLIALIDKFVPESDNPHESRMVEDAATCDVVHRPAKLLRTGMLTALAITVHNFPEGIATFIATVNKPTLGIAIAIAVAIHNIPEGIAVSIPFYCATGSRKKAFYLSLLSGLSEPLGAIVAYLILSPFINDVVFGISFASVAGIMVFISLDELLPAAREYGEHHLSIYGLVGGMAITAIGLLLLP